MLLSWQSDTAATNSTLNRNTADVGVFAPFLTGRERANSLSLLSTSRASLPAGRPATHPPSFVCRLSPTLSISLACDGELRTQKLVLSAGILVTKGQMTALHASTTRQRQQFCFFFFNYAFLAHSTTFYPILLEQKLLNCESCVYL